MDAIPIRRWYRLHWLTWIAVLIGCGGLTYCQFVKQVSMLSRDGLPMGGTYIQEFYFGWPAIFGKLIATGVSTRSLGGTPPSIKIAWHFPSLAFNGLVSLFIVLSMMWVMEVREPPACLRSAGICQR